MSGSGTVTFLFTDIEGSTRLWQAGETAMRRAVARHDELLQSVISEFGGRVFSTMGDGVAAVFPSVRDSVAAAQRAQLMLLGEHWSTAEPLRVRMGIHTGEAEEREGDYFGTAVNRAARLMAIGHGGQVLCSSATAELLEGAELINLGEHRLRDLSAPQRVFQIGEGRYPPLRSLEAVRTNLPYQVSSFIGRERELMSGLGALRRSRVVTLTGVGGVGKTRLAVQLAAEAIGTFPDGAWLVDLAPIRDPTAVEDAVGAVLGLAVNPGPAGQAVVELLRDKRLLLLLDNCEHLLDTVARMISLLQRSCRDLTVLATSREGLTVDGEVILAVPSLSLPGPADDLAAVSAADGVRLFTDRAQRVDSGFALTAANAQEVAEVCRRLDGVPLAIELAAARMGAMTPAELARGLDRRFETLAGGRRGAVARHQTLRAAIDWSYDLLSEPERRLLARLSVFAGGWAREAVQEVCEGDSVGRGRGLEFLAALVDRSLVVARRERAETRYSLLETVRTYAEERLAEYGETAELRRRHARYYCAFEHARWAETVGPAEAEAARRLQAEAENLFAAMTHALDEGDADLALRLFTNHMIGGQAIYFRLRYPLSVLELPAAPAHPLYPAALAVGSQFSAMAGDADTAEQYAMRALAMADPGSDDDLDSYVSFARSVACGARGDFAEAGRYAEESATASRVTGHRRHALALGSAAMRRASSDPDAALVLAMEGLAEARRRGSPSATILNLNAMASALAGSDPAEARSLLAESIGLRTALPYEGVLEVVTTMAAAVRLGDMVEVLELAPSAIRGFQWNNERPSLAGTLELVASALMASDPDTAGRIQRGARELLGVARATSTETPKAADEANPDDDRRIARSLADGPAMTIDQLVGLTLSAVSLALQNQRTHHVQG